MRQSKSTLGSKTQRSTPKINKKEDSAKSSEDKIVEKKNPVRKSHEIFKKEVEKPKQTKEPLLYLDVNFGGSKGVTRIIMYPNDTPEGIANWFAKEYNLSKEKWDRLIDAI